jgi:hypothetical protein
LNMQVVRCTMKLYYDWLRGGCNHPESFCIVVNVQRGAHAHGLRMSNSGECLTQPLARRGTAKRRHGVESCFALPWCMAVAVLQGCVIVLHDPKQQLHAALQLG